MYVIRQINRLQATVTPVWLVTCTSLDIGA